MHIKNYNDNDLYTHISDFPLLRVDCRLNGNCNTKRNQIIDEAKSLIGSKYAYASIGPSNFDSAGFVHYVYKVSINKILPVKLIELLQVGETISSIDNLLPGDLVFTSNGAHVGIYIGKNEIIHAPFNGQRVKSSIISSFYCGKRYL